MPIFFEKLSSYLLCINMKIVIGLSGGVDSAVAAHLLKQEGHEVIGVFMKNWEDDDTYCSSREDFVSAAACAEVIGIELHHINFARTYRDRVFTYFLDELRLGRTPNPDILCNSEVKFLAFLECAKNFSADGIATGHYAKKMINADGYTHHLYCCEDTIKDQTYFLYHLLPAQLAKAHFPLANLTKKHVRDIAKQAGIPSANRADSTGICFIGERPFREFLSRYLPKEEGAIVDENGRVLGKHQGLAFYTIGQRKGLHIGGVKGANESPWFVCRKNLKNNQLVVVQGHQHKKLYSQTVSADHCHWLEKPPQLDSTNRFFAKVRHRQTLEACKVITPNTNATIEQLTVHFEKPQWAVTSGQSLVLYRQNHDGIECLGGGLIQ